MTASVTAVELVIAVVLVIETTAEVLVNEAVSVIAATVQAIAVVLVIAATVQVIEVALVIGAAIAAG